MAGKKTSDQVLNGRYVQGGSVDRFPDRLGWWERRILPSSIDDVEIVIPPKYSKRPDLLTAEVYGRATLMWIILQYNNIVDINTEFVEGKTIRVPTAKRVFTQFLTNSSINNLR